MWRLFILHENIQVTHEVHVTLFPGNQIPRVLGCILLGLFWLFLFRFRNNIIHGISISKRTLPHVSDLETESEVRTTISATHLSVAISIPIKFFQLEAGRDRCWLLRRISRQTFPKRTRILSIPSITHSFHSVHSAIGSRMNGMIVHSFRKRNSSQKNTDSVYSDFSYSRIVPKERALKIT